MYRPFQINIALFILFHILAFSVFFVDYRSEYLWLLIGTYFGRMFFITAGYHRYFSHRSYKTSRIFQFFMAFMAMTSSQKGVLWWASHHRDHHRHSDQDNDIHSPNQGWIWSHMGWFLSPKFDPTDLSKIKDFSKYPELCWLNKHWSVPVWIYAFILYAVGGLPYLAWGFFLSTVLLWHGTFTINSIAHLWGTRRFETEDRSRNNFFLSLITLGEGWHNNHHRFPNACRNGHQWWELDFTFYILKILSWMRIVSNLRPIPFESRPAFSKLEHGKAV